MFKTKAHPDVIEEALLEYLKNSDITPTTVDAKKYKIKFDMTRTGIDNKPQEIGLRVSILKHATTEGEYYVEFTKNKGPNYAFNQIYKDLTVKKGALHFAVDGLVTAEESKPLEAVVEEAKAEEAQ